MYAGLRIGIIVMEAYTVNSFIMKTAVGQGLPYWLKIYKFKRQYGFKGSGLKSIFHNRRLLAA
jgi:hypothetical protein